MNISKLGRGVMWGSIKSLFLRQRLQMVMENKSSVEIFIDLATALTSSACYQHILQQLDTTSAAW